MHFTLPDKSVEDLRRIYQMEYGFELSLAEARDIAARLYDLFEILNEIVDDCSGFSPLDGV